MRRTAIRFRMSLSSVYRIKHRYEETGQLQAKKPRGRLPAIDAEGEAWLKEKVASDLTLASLCEKYEQSQGRKVSISVMHRALKRMKIGLKKTFYDPKRESEPVKKKREEYCEEIAELDPSKLIFLDEMGAALNLTPTYGRSVKGTRACGEKPTSPGTRISTLGAMTMNAMLTAMCFEGYCSTSTFSVPCYGPVISSSWIMPQHISWKACVSSLKAKAHVYSICRLILLITIPLN